jgi:signal transduction histidine kinase
MASASEPTRTRSSSNASTATQGKAAATTTAPPAPISVEERDALRQQIRDLQRISSLGVIAGSICHELNNMLTPILNYAKLGLRDTDPAFRQKSFEKILEAAQRASVVTTGVLGLARPQADRRDPTDLALLTEQVLLLTNKDLQKHRVRPQLTTQGRPHARVNPAQIQQVLLNLIINARQAMPEGGELTLHVGLDPASPRTAEIRVADTGTGIPPDALRHIFEPFFTTKTGPDATGLGGTGLGLPVCREIVEAHKGRLRVESRPGRGTTFTLRLPACAAPASTKEARQGAA